MKQLTFYIYIFVVILALCKPAQALNTPKSFFPDTRVRYVAYNPHDVIQIETVIGIATHIMVEEGEQYITHAFGDSEAWAFSNEQNHYFIKPKALEADTNLTIVTNKRTYYFRLRYHEGNDNLAMYGVVFRYPDLISKEKEARNQKLAIEHGFMGQRGCYNLSYTMSGDTDIAPINVWDNDEFTYFKFYGNKDIPGIYMVDAEGLESIVNRNVEGSSNNIIVVHKVNHKWVLRLGSRALAIFNENYNPVGIMNSTGTVSPIVKRTIKGEK
jgi:type IV secretion system protein VirB9